MTKYAVGYISFFDNDLQVVIVEATGWKEALSKHPQCVNKDGTPGDFTWLPDDMKEAKDEIINADCEFDVKEI